MLEGGNPAQIDVCPSSPLHTAEPSYFTEGVSGEKLFRKNFAAHRSLMVDT